MRLGGVPCTRATHLACVPLSSPAKARTDGTRVPGVDGSRKELSSPMNPRAHGTHVPGGNGSRKERPAALRSHAPMNSLMLGR